MTHITTEVNEYPLIRLANNSGVQQICLIGGVGLNSRDTYIVFLNGKLTVFKIRTFLCTAIITIISRKHFGHSAKL